MDFKKIAALNYFYILQASGRQTVPSASIDLILCVQNFLMEGSGKVKGWTSLNILDSWKLLKKQPFQCPTSRWVQVDSS